MTAELENKPAVKAVAWGDGPLVAIGGMTWGTSTDKEQDITFKSYPVSHNFLDVFGIKIVDGRNFLPFAFYLWGETFIKSPLSSVCSQ